VNGIGIDPTLYEAYRTTRYSALVDGEEIVLRVDTTNPALAALMRRHGVTGGCFVTAWNPRGEDCGEAENERANALLRLAIQAMGCHFFEGEGKGTSGDWPAETSYLALGCSGDDAKQLCTDFRQNAVLWFGTDAVPRLVLHPDLEAA